MIKFIHKKHINKGIKGAYITIYYSVSDIFLGIILIILVAFFINNYLSNSLKKTQSNCLSYPKAILNIEKNS